MVPICFEGMVCGHPIPQGSLSPIARIDKSGRARVSVFQKKELLDWRSQISKYIIDKYELKEVPFKKGTPVSLTLIFYFERPKSVSLKKRPYMITRPDLDKLIRSFLDSGTNILYDDDSQVISINAEKRYCDYQNIKEGVHFLIKEYSDMFFDE